MLNLSNIFKISMKLDYLKFLHISVYFASKTWLNLNNNAFHPRSLYWGAMIPSVRNKLKWKSDLQRNNGNSVGAGPSQSSQSFKLLIGKIGWTILEPIGFWNNLTLLSDNPWVSGTFEYNGFGDGVERGSNWRIPRCFQTFRCWRWWNHFSSG